MEDGTIIFRLRDLENETWLTHRHEKFSHCKKYRVYKINRKILADDPHSLFFKGNKVLSL